MSDDLPDACVVIADLALDAGVEQLKRADLTKDDLRLVVGRIYAAMEMVHVMLDVLDLEALETAPVDKSKLN